MVYLVRAWCYTWIYLWAVVSAAIICKSCRPAFPVSRAGTYMSTWKTCRFLKPGLIHWPGTNQFLVRVFNTHLPEQANDQNHWFWICSLFKHTALKRYKINRTAKDTCLLNFGNSPWLRTISNAGICWLPKGCFRCYEKSPAASVWSADGGPPTVGEKTAVLTKRFSVNHNLGHLQLVRTDGPARPAQS